MSTEPLRFDTKIAVLLREDLEPWQRLNVTAFLVSGLGTQVPEVIGEPYEDADGVGSLPMFRQPVLVFQGTKETLTAAHARVLSRALPRAVFTGDLFTTGNDRDNRAAVRAVPTAEPLSLAHPVLERPTGATAPGGAPRRRRPGAPGRRPLAPRHTRRGRRDVDR
ncbi:DUF2000 domain-containing protein [Streptomyces galbus]|uniref:DUF2000 domain-containing protein n=1 Tax=Streptomyces galbus TaxID=33898 RepID=UPI001FF8CF3B|nr:DUF2000 domain-containing protein [Streptomyces galbus]